MVESSKRFLVMSERGGVSLKPKHHLLQHVGQRALYEGSPSEHATWEDETLNRNLSQIAASAHRKVWELRILAHFDNLMQSRKRTLAGNSCT